MPTHTAYAEPTGRLFRARPNRATLIIMDKTVPAGAAILLDFIGNTEVGRKPPEAYDVIYGHKQGKLPKPLTAMTLDEVTERLIGFVMRAVAPAKA